MKKLLALLLILAMVFSLMTVMTACSEEDYDYSDEDEDEDEDDEDKDDEDEKDDEDTKDDEDDEDQDDEGDDSESLPTGPVIEIVDPVLQIMSYEEFLEAPVGSKVSVVTYVQATQAYDGRYMSIYCQDPDGAYFLYDVELGKNLAEMMTPGMRIMVIGTKERWEGEIEIGDATVLPQDDGDKYIAEPRDLTDLLGDSSLENYMNQLSRFEGLTVENVFCIDDGADIYITFSYEGEEYDFCVESDFTGPDREVYQTALELQPGETVNVEGFLYWYMGPNPHITAIEKQEASDDVVLTGSWEGTSDLSELMNLAILDGMGEDYLEYLRVDQFDIRISLEFNKDGTYEMSMNRQDAQAAISDLKPQWETGLKELIKVYGLTQEEFEEQIGMSLKRFVREQLEGFAYSILFDNEGTYTVEGNKLYFDGDSEYVTVVRNGTEFVMTDCSDVDYYEMFSMLYLDVIFYM